MNIDDYKKVMNRLEPDERCRNEVLNMGNKKKITKKSGRKSLAVAAVVAIAFCGSTVAAADHFGVFDTLKHNSERTVTNDIGNEFPVDKFDKNNYEAIGNNAEYLDETVTAENDGIKIEISSVYCDGQTLVIGLTGELKSGNSESASYIGFEPELLVNGELYSMKNYMLQGSHSNLILDEGAENSFSGSMTFVMDNDYRLAETAQIYINVPKFYCSETYWNEAIEITDGLSISLEVTPDLSLVNTMTNNTVKDDGFSAKVHEITPAMITISAEYPHSFDTIKKYMDIYFEERDQEPNYDYSIVPLYYDENDERIPFLEIDPIDLGLGKYAVCLQNSGAKVITVKFCNKQQADENGNPMVIKELKIDLNQLNQE